MLVKDHLDKPVSRVRVRLAERQITTKEGSRELMACGDTQSSGSDGLLFYICNPQKSAVRAELKVRETMHSLVPIILIYTAV